MPPSSDFTMADALARIAFRMCFFRSYVKDQQPLVFWIEESRREAYEQAAVNLKVTKNISSVWREERNGMHTLTVLPLGVHSLDTLTEPA